MTTTARDALLAELLASEDPTAEEYRDAVARVEGLVDAAITEGIRHPDPARVLADLQRGEDLPLSWKWRRVSLDYQPGIALECPHAEQHPGVPDIDIDHDRDGVYDCCPMPFIEVGWDSLADYLVELLNATACPCRAETVHQRGCQN